MSKQFKSLNLEKAENGFIIYESTFETDEPAPEPMPTPAPSAKAGAAAADAAAEESGHYVYKTYVFEKEKEVINFVKEALKPAEVAPTPEPTPEPAPEPTPEPEPPL